MPITVEQATVAVFAATATPEQIRLRDALVAAGGSDDVTLPTKLPSRRTPAPLRPASGPNDGGAERLAAVIARNPSGTAHDYALRANITDNYASILLASKVRAGTMTRERRATGEVGNPAYVYTARTRAQMEDPVVGVMSETEARRVDDIAVRASMSKSSAYAALQRLMKQGRVSREQTPTGHADSVAFFYRLVPTSA